MSNIVERIVQILKEEGLGGILILQTEEPKWDDGEFAEQKDGFNLSYASPPNGDGLCLGSFEVCYGVSRKLWEEAKSKLTDIPHVLELERMLTLHHKSEYSHWEDVDYEVALSVDGGGRIVETTFKTQTGFGRLFDGIDRNKGADFEPVFRKMVQLYKEQYHPTQTAEVAATTGQG